jgi:hypothetical protein
MPGPSFRTTAPCHTAHRRYTLNDDFRPAPAPAITTKDTIQAFDRGGTRSVGIRNYVIVLGTSSQAGPFVRRVEALFRSKLAASVGTGVP